jgi:hypothetical protein
MSAPGVGSFVKVNTGTCGKPEAVIRNAGDNLARNRSVLPSDVLLRARRVLREQLDQLGVEIVGEAENGHDA